MKTINILLIWCMVVNTKQQVPGQLEGKKRERPTFAGFIERKDLPRVQFRRLGITSAATEFGHIIVDFDLTVLTLTLTKLKKIMPKKDTPLYGRHPHHSFRFESLHRQVNDLYDRLAIVRLAGSTAAKQAEGGITRSKRFAFSIGVVAVIALTALTAGLFAAAEVKTMRNKVKSTGEAQEEQLQLIEKMLDVSKDL